MNSEALHHLESLPRIPLAFLPTPLLPGAQIRAGLGPRTPELLLKMDDWTGLALGGTSSGSSSSPWVPWSPEPTRSLPAEAPNPTIAALRLRWRRSWDSGASSS